MLRDIFKLGLVTAVGLGVVATVGVGAGVATLVAGAVSFCPQLPLVLLCYKFSFLVRLGIDACFFRFSLEYPLLNCRKMKPLAHQMKAVNQSKGNQPHHMFPAKNRDSLTPRRSKHRKVQLGSLSSQNTAVYQIAEALF
jgi:hypothetical protein